MLYRVISNAEFRNVHSLYSKKKGWIDSVHALFKISVCPKIDHFSKKLVFSVSDRSYYDLSFKKILRKD